MVSREVKPGVLLRAPCAGCGTRTLSYRSIAAPACSMPGATAVPPPVVPPSGQVTALGRQRVVLPGLIAAGLKKVSSTGKSDLPRFGSLPVTGPAVRTRLRLRSASTAYRAGPRPRCSRRSKALSVPSPSICLGVAMVPPPLPVRTGPCQVGEERHRRTWKALSCRFVDGQDQCHAQAGEQVDPAAAVEEGLRIEVEGAQRLGEPA